MPVKKLRELEFKCRRCEEVFSYEFGEASGAAVDFIEALDLPGDNIAREFHKDWPNANYRPGDPLFWDHKCRDGGRGLGDFIGLAPLTH